MEFLVPLGVSQTDFAKRIGVSYVRLNAIINGRRGVSTNTALRLQQATGMDAEFWLGLQADWDLWHELHSPQAEDIGKIERLPPEAARRGHEATQRAAAGRSSGSTLTKGGKTGYTT